jgi:predicted N-acetyltransferase YhbS
VLGHPEYYQPRGFRPAGALGFKPPYPIPEMNADAWMVKALHSRAFGIPARKVICADTLNKPEYWRE